MNEQRKNAVIGGIISGCVPVIAGIPVHTFIPNVKTYLSNHTDFSFWSIIFLLGLLFVLFFLLTHKQKNKHQELSDFRSNKSGNKRFSIVIVDDTVQYRDLCRSALEGYDITVVRNIDDIRLLMSYDIIVLDILKATMSGNDTTNFIKEIHSSKAYKYLILISIDSELLNQHRQYADACVLKNGTFKQTLSSEVEKAFRSLDCPQKYWTNSVLPKIEDIPEHTKEKMKADYLHSLLCHNSYTH